MPQTPGQQSLRRKNARGLALCANQGSSEAYAVTAPLVPTVQPNEIEDFEDFEGTGVEGVFQTEKELEELLNSPLPTHPKLHRGFLPNGMKYVILPNSVPPNRFEAHLEMHVGSVDELENEQGLAHLIEHVTFLGSRKREKLLGTGARSNAYTDFHHTVFHVHSPVTMQGSGEPMLPMVLDALHEIAFRPKFLQTRIDKERKAVLSELQMMNTIEYRVDCQLLQHLHSENQLSCRFPIGLEEQIRKWDADLIRAFHERWYFPANATLYVVGDIGSVSRAIEAIKAQFASTPAAMYYPKLDPVPSPPPLSKLPLPPSASPPSPPSTPAGELHPSSASSSEASPIAIPKTRHKIRPPVEHRWSGQNLEYAQIGTAAPPGTVVMPSIFQHELLQNFSLTLFCKNPARKVQKFKDLRNALMLRIVLSTFQFRINQRYKAASPPFLGIEWDHSDSGREACTVATVTITSEPRHWQGAVKVAMQEIRRLKEFGITRGELARYLTALLKDSEQLAAMIDSIPSIDNLDFVMESDALGHSIMDQQQGFECLSAIADTVSHDDVNELAGNLLDFIADYGQPSAPIPAAIVACVPTHMHHSDTNADVAFNISSEEIRQVMLEGLLEKLEPEPEVEVPKALISAEQLAILHEQTRPTFVAVDGKEGGPLRSFDEATGIIQRRLSNGIRVNMKITQNEAKGGVLRLAAPGGRVQEDPTSGGAVAIGVRTLSEGGTVGGYAREQVELFCVSNMINCILEADEEFICMDFHFTTRHGGLAASFQLIHMVLQHSVWVEDAFDRAKQLYLSHYRSLPKSLERFTAHTLMKAMFRNDQRLIEPNPTAISELTLPAVKEAVLNQLLSGELELSIVGDFSEEEVEKYLLDYMATITSFRGSTAEPPLEPPFRMLPTSDASIRNQRVMLRDTDERACAYIAGSSPNRWGFTADGVDVNTIMEPVPPGLEEDQAKALAPLGVTVVEKAAEDGSVQRFWRRSRHPLFCSVAMLLLTEIVNARLFTTVRDALGLTYDVSFEASLFDRLATGWFVITVTSTPAKIENAVDASLNVLRGIQGNRITQRELDRAKRTCLMRFESDQKDNGYWLGLLTHVQADAVPRKDVSCIRDCPYLYEVATIEDIYTVYNHLSLDDDSLFTCVGVAGSAVEADGNVESVLAVPELLEEESPESTPSGSLVHGRGMSTMTRPTM